MTTEAATSFAERLKNDEALQAKLAGVASGEERLALVREAGFDLSADDGDAVKRALGIEELSDEDLERIAGGSTTTSIVVSAVGSAAGSAVTVVAAAAAI
jgi:predicted ribosomally synthesized peptide with nif11-like leader